MLDEIISAIAGSVVAKLLSKLAPARMRSEFATVPFETLERRNRLLYFGMLAAAILGFFSPFLFTPVEHARGGWFAGAIFGLPFSAMLIYILAIWSLLDGRRARELLFYFEIKQKVNVYVFCFLGSPLAVIGVVSFMALVRR
jgi:hypothetical protein